MSKTALVSYDEYRTTQKREKAREDSRAFFKFVAVVVGSLIASAALFAGLAFLLVGPTHAATGVAVSDARLVGHYSTKANVSVEGHKVVTYVPETLSKGDKIDLNLYQDGTVAEHSRSNAVIHGAIAGVAIPVGSVLLLVIVVGGVSGVMSTRRY